MGGGHGGPGLEWREMEGLGDQSFTGFVPLLPYIIITTTKMKRMHRFPLLVRILPLLFSMSFILLGTMGLAKNEEIGFVFLNWVLGVLCLGVYLINRWMDEMKRLVMDHRGIMALMRLKKIE